MDLYECHCINADSELRQPYPIDSKAFVIEDNRRRRKYPSHCMKCKRTICRLCTIVGNTLADCPDDSVCIYCAIKKMMNDKPRYLGLDSFASMSDYMNCHLTEEVLANWRPLYDTFIKGHPLLQTNIFKVSPENLRYCLKFIHLYCFIHRLILPRCLTNPLNKCYS